MIITGGKYRSRKLISPSEKIVKPTLSKVRESVFNILSSRIDFNGLAFLDLFAGSGIVGFEAISRGFSHLVSIDNNANNIALIKKNAQILGISGKFIKYDALKFLKSAKESFDVIFIDPPYNSNLVNNSLFILSQSNILNNNGIIFIETTKENVIDILDFKLIKEVCYGLAKLMVLTKA